MSSGGVGSSGGEVGATIAGVGAPEGDVAGTGLEIDLRAGAMRSTTGAVLVAMAVFVVHSPIALAQWLPNQQTFAIQRIGLFGPAHTGSTGLQFSAVSVFNHPGFAAGYSRRITGVDTFNGQDAWVWNGVTTTQIGLVGTDYAGSAGFQSSETFFQSATGQVAGTSRRITGVNANNGENAWVWNGATTTQIGLTGTGYTGSAGFQFSRPLWQNDDGQIVGTSQRVISVNTNNGSNTWVWNGATTMKIGLSGEVYTGSAGYQLIEPRFQNAAGQIVGISTRITGVNTNNGWDVWVWNGTSIIQIGFTGAGYTGIGGYQFSSPRFQNTDGQVVGTSSRISGFSVVVGWDTWVWNGTTTTRIGLIGGANTGVTGIRYSIPLFQNADGQVAGTSFRIAGANDDNGTDAWVWNGTTTSQIGLAGASYTGSAGYQLSEPRLQNASGQVVGITRRITGVETYNGQDAWAWNGTTTTPIGLTGTGYTRSTGFQFSDPRLQNANGQVAGVSSRIAGADIASGLSAWVWNGATTTRVGLTGAPHTGTNGFQFSEPRLQNAAGQVVGISHRYFFTSTQRGQDVWYFDPATGVSSQITGSFNTFDNYAFSQGTILTDDGFLLGEYTFYALGRGNGEQRAFIFRPDVGFTDLGNLVKGGLSESGWRTLHNPLFADALRTIVGYGSINGQAQGQGAFVMTAQPSGACCRGSTCSVTILADCSGSAARYAGNNTVCPVPGATALPCCRADFDQSATPTALDIFAFLNAWFATPQDPRANFDGLGGIDAADIFAFLNAWFAGC